MSKLWNQKSGAVGFSSKDDTWGTPQSFYHKLDMEFSFTLDPCASDSNAKCTKYYTEADDGLAQDWGGETVFMNPPYGRDIKKWIKKAREESEKPNTTVVCLIPSRTDTRYWHDHVMQAKEIRFVKGRLKFGDAENAAPFPSAVVVFYAGPLSPVLRVM
jgi:site-specific DNA-methyltransferase (adenine-specific)